MENLQILETKEIILDFWTGNPTVDLWSGQLKVKEIDNSNSLSNYKTEYVCCPKIPTHMHIIEFCQFIEKMQKSINKVRVLRGCNSSEYIVVIKLNSIKEAMDFVKTFNKRKFNQIEPDLCIIYQVIQANMKRERGQELEIEEQKPQTMQRSMSADIKPVFFGFQELSHVDLTQENQFNNPSILFEDGKVQSNCPICLESLTNEGLEIHLCSQSSPISLGFNLSPTKILASTIIKDFSEKQLKNRNNNKVLSMESEKLRGGENDFTLTILCCHSFHWMCLKNWTDTTCPLCRYLQSPVDSSQCDDCGANENLWICLVCGHIGCFNLMMAQQQRHQIPMLQGIEEENLVRNTRTLQGKGHSFDHYLESKHVYAMEMDTQNVWDFSKENYVHRLIQNQLDGKLIEFGDPNDSNSNSDNGGSQRQNINGGTGHQQSDKDFTVDSLHRYNKKIESLNFEYNQMLGSTLENQRSYYENILSELNQEEQEQIVKKKQQILVFEESIKDIDDKIEQSGKDIEDEKENFQNLRQIYASLLQEYFQTEQENKTLKIEQEKLNTQFEDEVQKLKKELQECDGELDQIKQQKTDIMSHMKIQNKLRKHKLSDEIVGGQAFILDTGNGSQTQNNGKGNKKSSRKNK